MKRLIKCLICGSYIPYYRTYKATVEESISPFVGVWQTVKREGRICKTCAVKCGYIVKGVNKFVVDTDKIEGVE